MHGWPRLCTTRAGTALNATRSHSSTPAWAPWRGSSATRVTHAVKDTTGNVHVRPHNVFSTHRLAIVWALTSHSILGMLVLMVHGPRTSKTKLTWCTKMSCSCGTRTSTPDPNASDQCMYAKLGPTCTTPSRQRRALMSRVTALWCQVAVLVARDLHVPATHVHSNQTKMAPGVGMVLGARGGVGLELMCVSMRNADDNTHAGPRPHTGKIRRHLTHGACSYTAPGRAVKTA